MESGWRPAGAGRTPEAVVIGASTGGPAAISSIIRSLPRSYPAAVSVALHMPHWLAAPFVERLNASSSMRVRIAGDGEKVEKGAVVVAPGGVHLSFIRKKGSVYTILTGKRTSDIFVPSIDRMFSSASEVWGAALIGVVLTGMGRDGVMGVEAIKDAGGVVVAESEESAAVPSMPKAAAATGKVALTMPAHRIGMWLAGRRATGKGGEGWTTSPETALKKERISDILA